MSVKITGIIARMVLDSRGIPTVEATVRTDRSEGTASVPAGTSSGAHEAREVRDGDRRWNGQGVRKAVSHVNVEIARALRGADAADQGAIDARLQELDRAKRSGLGANALLAVSLATLQAAAEAAKEPLWRYVAEGEPRGLPVPMLNVLNGGAHADNGLSIQEFMILPIGFDAFSEALRAGAETYRALYDILVDRGLSTGVGLEGGFAPELDGHHDALDLLLQAIERAGYRPGEQIALALDVAASELYRGGGYRFDGHTLSAEQLAIEYETLTQRYPLVSLEDPYAEDDWGGWKALKGRVATQVVADDLTVTDAKRITKAATEAGISGVILKPNQAGTYTEAAAARRVAAEQGLAAIASHRSRETTDAWISDLAVGWETGFIKAGAPARGERVAKYNRLLAIERAIGSQAVYHGRNALVTTEARHA
ncbi:MAG: phosphopyruvate hydratase [Patescibacteria group bacterium]